MTTTEIIAQTIGFVAFALGVASFLQKKDINLKILLMIQAMTLCVHFILLGRYTGAVAVFITGVRNGLSLFGWAKKLAPLFYLSVLGFGWYTFDEWIDIFPILAGLIGTTAFFFLSGIRMRLTLVISSSMWLTHNILVGSIGPSIMEGFMVCAGLYRAYRLNIEHKRALGNDPALTP
ncbi:MAG: YgjV family protein [Micavibrio aeruginosavorus]|uniref:YgjV family protein n=1 Tax=Micavibrio aeruginosavorus TaxID=349221 RepID=A0A2W5PP95_9BACT|nr:MAG: YgjV family protein [Micavibrio aeruginosavorus]